MRKIELLSPAGNMECLKAAVQAGCDAVYLSGNLFGARSFAGNFSNDELVSAIKYAHLYGVKVYVTINTLIYEREVDNFINFVRFIHENNCDAVLVQDIGMLSLIRSKFPNLVVHASTQMHIHNYEGALLMKELGVKRVVLARETNIDVIKKISSDIDIETEVFVHGALCVSYSGQCLMSYLIGGRSGNRGTCAQACRKPYDLYDLNDNKLNSDNYLLSTKDLCTINDIGNIIDSGVTSLKIEGRMKRPEYVYLVTKLYKKAIDNYLNTGKTNITKDDMDELLKMFNRNFTKGFILNEENNNITSSDRPNHRGIRIGIVNAYKDNMVSIKLKGDVSINDGLRIIDNIDHGILLNKMYVNDKLVKNAKKGDVISVPYDNFINISSPVMITTSNKQIKSIDNMICNNDRMVSIKMNVSIMDKMFRLEVSDGVNNVIEEDIFPSLAIKHPTSKETVLEQLSKTGDTVYHVDNVNIDMKDNLFINIKDINSIRRLALKKLDDKRLYDIPFKECDYNLMVPNFKKEELRTILVNNKEEYDKYHDEYDNIYCNTLINNNVILKLNRVISKYPVCNKTVLIGELGSLTKYKDFETDFSFNVVNSYSVAFLHSMGAKKVTLSYELTPSQMKLLINSYEARYGKHPNVEVIVDSYPEAMICKFDLAKKYCLKEAILKDSYGNNYMIKSNDEFMTIYDYQKKIYKDVRELYSYGVNSIRTNL